MKKEEFLAVSLPYGLKGIVKGEENLCGSFIYKLYSCNCETNVVELVGETNFKTDKFKPILHKLSDLTKEIEHNGEKFIPIIKLAEIAIKNSIIKDIAPTIEFDYRIVNKPFGKLAKCSKLGKWYIIISLNEPLRANFWIIQKLIEWKFDIAGLIEKGEAIDVNTLNTNPYR